MYHHKSSGFDELNGLHQLSLKHPGNIEQGVSVNTHTVLFGKVNHSLVQLQAIFSFSNLKGSWEISWVAKIGIGFSFSSCLLKSWSSGSSWLISFLSEEVEFQPILNCIVGGRLSQVWLLNFWFWFVSPYRIFCSRHISFVFPDRLAFSNELQYSAFKHCYIIKYPKTPEKKTTKPRVKILIDPNVWILNDWHNVK